METIIKVLIIPLILFNTVLSQTYNISIFGYHIGDLIKIDTPPNKVELNLRTRGLSDMFYPTNNSYKTTYDPVTFMLKEYEYEIDQINLKKNTLVKTEAVNNNILSKDLYYLLPSPAFNFISFLEFIKTKNKTEIDTKWFPFESGKEIGRVRALWADSTNVYSGMDSIMCNHYRLDIEIDNPSEIDKIDYLNKYLIQKTNIKELWISIKSPKIYSIKISNSFLSLDVTIAQ